MRRRPSVSLVVISSVALALVAVACGEADDTVPAAPLPGACSPEGSAEYCYPGPPSARGIGLCTDGARSCAGGVWSECAGYTLPVEEVCGDHLDNNCNGVEDEACPCQSGAVQPCYTGPSSTRGIGLCVAGQQSCESGTWSNDCIGQGLPTTEECDEQDDDCNGIVDDGCACVTGTTVSCYSGPPQTADSGTCRTGTQQCLDGQWETTCAGEITPSPELCNLLDDDCDGSADEGLGTTTCGTPPCDRTVENCVAGVAQACQPLCDGVTCTSGSQCATGYCKEGRCCNAACTTPCRTCATGTCTVVSSGFDNPECTGTQSCDAAGNCKKVNGQICSNASECVSGFCKDGRCCNSACTTPCRSCATGTCSVVASGVDNPECTGTYLCNAAGTCCNNYCPSHDACGTNGCGNSCGPACVPHQSYPSTCMSNRCIWQFGCESGIPCNTGCAWGLSTCVGTNVGSCSSCVDPDNQICYCWPNP